SSTGSTNWTAKIKAVASGKATITFDPVIGPPKTCVVNVAYIEPNNATLTPNPLNVTVGKTKKLSISFSPEGASAKKIIWESSNSNIATVSTSGQVKGVAEGNAVITATTDNGIKATANIVVLPLPTSVSLPNSLTVFVGYSKTITPTVLPENTETSYTWKSSDSSVATISSGKITGVKAGKTTITVTTANGKTANCLVTIKSAPVELNAKNATNRASVIETIVKRSIK
ncbi:MAG: Ig-like domain-containing protein, partial [Muribaculaceae bacterium]|nr:Ig-like domain-containing protein [Muribaculaceae bacterium]